MTEKQGAVILERIRTLEREVEKHYEEVCELIAIIRGSNGDKMGLIEKVRQLSGKIKTLEDELHDIQILIGGDPQDAEKVGMKANMQTIIKEIRGFKKLAWMALGVAISGLVQATVMFVLNGGLAP